jgi:hypothetical protein
VELVPFPVDFVAIVPFWKRERTMQRAVEHDFDRILSPEIKQASALSGAEWLIPFYKLNEVIELATQHSIAVLGIEVFRVLSDGLGTEGYSGYEFKLDGNWADFVSQNNKSATAYIVRHQFGEGHGYILTTTSENEFAHSRDHING